MRIHVSRHEVGADLIAMAEHGRTYLCTVEEGASSEGMADRLAAAHNAVLDALADLEEVFHESDAPAACERVRVILRNALNA